MEFNSILFLNLNNLCHKQSTEVIHDLNLSKVFDSCIIGKEEYSLMEFFVCPLCTKDEVEYRQEIMKDIDGKKLYQILNQFSLHMKESKEWKRNAERAHYNNLSAIFHLKAIRSYLDAIIKLQREMSNLVLNSVGMKAFLLFITKYTESIEFREMYNATEDIIPKFEAIWYTLCIKGNEIEVNPYKDELDLSQIVTDFFDRFSDEKKINHQIDIGEKKRLNHIEEQIVTCLSKEYPECFDQLQTFCDNQSKFYNETVIRFEREVQFYLSYITVVKDTREKGVRFCYPMVSTENKEVYCQNGCDLPLQLINPKLIVENSFCLQEPERSIIVTGPNQGGKTTFARMIGQLVYLTSLGLPIPASNANFFLPDRIFTHFEKQEHEVTGCGKLQDDIVRIHDILKNATSKSLLLINEMFASTTLADALELGRAVMQEISQKDMFCIYVTFLEELAFFEANCQAKCNTFEK